MAAFSHPAVWAKLKLQKASERWQPDTEVGENRRVFGVASHDSSLALQKGEERRFTAGANLIGQCLQADYT